MATNLTTAVIDIATGDPVPNLAVSLTTGDGKLLAERQTNEGGHVYDLSDEPLPVGAYRLVYGTGEYFASRGVDHFYPEAIIAFKIDRTDISYEILLEVTQYSYATYRRVND